MYEDLGIGYLHKQHEILDKIGWRVFKELGKVKRCMNRSQQLENNCTLLFVLPVGDVY